MASTRSTNPGERFWAESALGVFGIPRRPTSFGPARAYFSAARLQQTWANDWLGSFVLSKCACASLIIRKASATSEAEISSALNAARSLGAYANVFSRRATTNNEINGLHVLKKRSLRRFGGGSLVMPFSTCL